MAHLQHHRARLGGLSFHYVSSGPQTGPPVILLHGFPEFWYGWRHQIPALADAGYFVLAPDQRGYNLTEKPASVSAYMADILVEDVFLLADELDIDTFHLVGHDWGAVVAWWLAVFKPERLRTLSILNVPHPAVMSRHLRSDFRQMLRSWYALFFQIPRLPELVLGLGNSFGLVRALRRSGLPETFSEENIANYREAWRQPGALRGMLNWYRAAARRPNRRMPAGRIRVPTQIIWGEQDVALRVVMAEESVSFCANASLHRFPQATHWVQHDEPEAVNQLLLEHLRTNESGSSTSR